ncbi:MAG: hypothetical protein MUF19_04235 [Candidatus Pacebacteria bacterium]|jgi:hypothetical protein|nr:hypothetical protein [Candidatus Paceibacterota bacterium]
MTDVQKEESQKTVVSFIFGLLIGGLLVWAFVGGNGGEHKDDIHNEDGTESATSTDDNMDAAGTSTPEAVTMATLPVGDGKVVINDKKAGREVKLAEVTYPIEEGWIGVREYNDGKLGYINGVIRFSKAGNMVPTTIPLVTPTVAGREYAVMMYTNGGDKSFNSASDKQIDTVFAIFTAE